MGVVVGVSIWGCGLAINCLVSCIDVLCVSFCVCRCIVWACVSSCISICMFGVSCVWCWCNTRYYVGFFLLDGVVAVNLFVGTGM